MSGLVADASVVIKTILAESGSEDAVGLLATATTLRAPQIIIAECANAIWKRVHRGFMDAGNVSAPLGDLMAAPIRLIGLRTLTPAALALSLEYDHPIYDCYYLAAAIEADCELATADARLYDLAQRAGLGARAILVR